jgi:hypothetical protein
MFDKKQWYLDNKEKILLKRKIYDATDKGKEVRRRSDLKRILNGKKRNYQDSRTGASGYFMTRSNKEFLYNKQGGACLICQKGFNINKIVIDHNHNTGKIRGLLCNSCNSVLGFSYDNIDILKNSIKYLENFN